MAKTYLICYWKSSLIELPQEYWIVLIPFMLKMALNRSLTYLSSGGGELDAKCVKQVSRNLQWNALIALMIYAKDNFRECVRHKMLFSKKIGDVICPICVLQHVFSCFVRNRRVPLIAVTAN